MKTKRPHIHPPEINPFLNDPRFAVRIYGGWGAFLKKPLSDLFRIPYLLVLLALLVAIGACAPKEAPAPAPTPVATAVAPTMPTLPAVAGRPQDAGWAKTVEAAKKEGKVTVYSFQFIGDLGPAMADAFFKKYGIKAEIITGPGAGLAERVRTEQRMKNVVADVGETSPAYSVVLLQEGSLLPMAQELPVLREDVWLTSPRMDDGGYILRHTIAYYSPWINTDLVKPDQEPKSWADILNPKWQGKILGVDPLTTTASDRFVHMLTKYKMVDANFLPKLAAQKLIIPTGVGLRPPYVALARGEGAILAFGSDSTGGVVIAEGGHIKPTAPREGVFAASSALQLIKNSPHPNSGKLFINFVLSQQGHEMSTRMRLSGSLRKDVPDSSVFAGLERVKIFSNTIEDEDQISKNFGDGVAAKLLGRR